MLVTFSTKHHENIMMFGDIALALIKMMGHSGTIPSAILAKDVPEALRKLEQAIQNSPAALATLGARTNKTEDEEPQVSLKNRAYPLIALLKSAIHHHADVMWHS